jgi:hypothetical protein
MSEKIERIARTLLWLSLAAVAALIPVAALRQVNADESAKAALQELQSKLDEATADKPVSVISFETLRPGLTVLDPRESKGAMLFTNVSERSGVVCVQGVAVNRDTGATSESMPACHAVEPFASNVAVELMFAGLADFCQSSGCTMRVQDAKVHAAR